MKQLMITVKPEYLANILNGKKTLELRTYIPKDFTGWVNIACGKGKPYLFRIYEQVAADNELSYFELSHKIIEQTRYKSIEVLNGKVVCRFWFDEYYELKKLKYANEYYKPFRYEPDISYNLMLDRLSLSNVEVWNYGKSKDLYAWHIKKLEIFPEPKELGEFYREEYAVMPNGIFPAYQPLTHAPQKMTYVWVKEE